MPGDKDAGVGSSRFRKMVVFLSFFGIDKLQGTSSFDI